MAPICLIIYLEGKFENKNFKNCFKYAYFVFKTIGTLHKIYWDFFIDWDLFQKRKDPQTPKFLRDKRKFPTPVYYLCMLFDIFGLCFWVIVLILYRVYATEKPDTSLASLEFYSNVMWITWLEMLVYATRRTIWTFIRVEAEYFGNIETYRDIVTVPPISKD